MPCCCIRSPSRMPRGWCGCTKMCRPPNRRMAGRAGSAASGVREYLALRAEARTLSHVVAHAIAVVSVAGGVDTSQRELTALTANAFAMLGVQPMLGRTFTAEEDQPGRD